MPARLAVCFLLGHGPIADFITPDKFCLRDRKYRLLLVTGFLEDLVIGILQHHPELSQATNLWPEY
jgi:hypothetical protein